MNFCRIFKRFLGMAGGVKSKKQGADSKKTETTIQYKNQAQAQT